MGDEYLVVKCLRLTRSAIPRKMGRALQTNPSEMVAIIPFTKHAGHHSGQLEMIGRVMHEPAIPDYLMMDLRGLRIGDKVMASQVELNEGLRLVRAATELRCSVLMLSPLDGTAWLSPIP